MKIQEIDAESLHRSPLADRQIARWVAANLLCYVVRREDGELLTVDTDDDPDGLTLPSPAAWPLENAVTALSTARTLRIPVALIRSYGAEELPGNSLYGLQMLEADGVPLLRPDGQYHNALHSGLPAGDYMIAGVPVRVVDAPEEPAPDAVASA